MTAYYNENDPFAADWLENLIEYGLIPAGDVDRRSITEVCGDDVSGYTQCHFFAGIGGWPLAMRLAGIPDDVEFWTGSCPCQPFSNPGRKGGSTDKRHLWPEFRRLIKDRRPAKVAGEQVESPLGRAWLAAVLADLEEIGYPVAATGLPAACVGAPQGRPRIWWLADADYTGRQGREREGEPNQAWEERPAARRELVRSVGRSWPPGPGHVNEIPLLANGVSGVVGGCKAYGNAIVPEVAAEFLMAWMEATANIFDSKTP